MSNEKMTNTQEPERVLGAISLTDPNKTFGARTPEEQEQVEPQDLSLKKSEEELIRRALEKHGGNRKLAADELGMSERTLYRKLPEEFKKKK